MYFSTNVMFRTLHSNSTIYLSTWLPSGDVKPHAVVPQLLTMGVGRLPISRIADKVCHLFVHVFNVLQFSLEFFCTTVFIDQQPCTNLLSSDV